MLEQTISFHSEIKKKKRENPVGAYGMHWLHVILCTHPTINHCETIDFSQFSLLFNLFFYALALPSIGLVQLVNSGISDAFIDYDYDDDDDDGATDNIDSKFIFQFHLNNTVTGARKSKREKSVFYIHIRYFEAKWIYTG